MDWFVNLLFLVVGAGLTFAFGYFGKYLEQTKLKARGDSLSNLAGRRLSAAIELVERWNSVGWSLDVMSYGSRVLVLVEGDKRSESDSEALKAHRPNARKAVEDFYAFVAKNSAVLGPDVMRVFHWFDVQFNSLKLQVSLESHNDIALGQVARNCLNETQSRFYAAIEGTLKDAGLKLLQPADIVSVREGALSDLKQSIDVSLKQWPDPPDWP